ncbi:MAG: ROK family protein [Marinilabiliales bacterium]|nr:ROK family protein [Marinilabiliales bacterium]
MAARITSRRVAEAAAAGDVIAKEALDQTARMIALGIANAVIFSSPETIFLFGGLAQAGDALFVPVRKYADELVQPVFRGTFNDRCRQDCRKQGLQYSERLH